jgi:hypothetical protein
MTVSSRETVRQNGEWTDVNNNEVITYLLCLQQRFKEVVFCVTVNGLTVLIGKIPVIF